MKDLFFIIIFFCIGFISNVDIEIHEETSTYNLTSGETYVFYVPMKQLAKIEIKFISKDFIYFPSNSLNINEYSSLNGKPIRNHIIELLENNINKKYYYYFDYILEDFSTNYISFAIVPNSTIENVEIGVYIFGGLYNMSNGVTESFEYIFNNEPLYLSIPATCNSIISIDLTIETDIFYYDINDIYDILENLILIEYQKSDSNYNIYVYQNYTMDYEVDEYEMIISFNYFITNIDTNFFCIKLIPNYEINNVTAKLSVDKYYFTLYDKKSLNIFDLIQNNSYHFNIKAKKNQLFNISFSILDPNFNDTQLPLKYIFISEDQNEFSSSHLATRIYYNMSSLSESFLYPVSEFNTNYLLLSIKPTFYIEQFNIAYQMIKEITTSFNLEKNVLLNLADLYPNISYYLSVSSKTLEIIKYEITINNIDLLSKPFDYIYIYEYPSLASSNEKLYFIKDGKV